MSENTIPPSSTPQTAPAPAPVVGDQAAAHAVPQVTATPSASVTATAAAATAAVNNSLNGANELLPCQWQHCTEKCPTAEALYVCLIPNDHPAGGSGNDHRDDRNPVLTAALRRTGTRL